MDLGAALRDDGLYLQDDFLSGVAVSALRSSLRKRRARGEFGAARVGGGRNLQRNAAIRGDFTCWLSEPLFAAEHDLLLRLEQLRLQVNRELFLGAFELELHYACYPPGAAYQKHVDQPADSTRRLLSIVLYLNDDWQPAQGGALRVFAAAGTYHDIQPVAGRLVCFLSAGREHAVCAAQRERLSVAGWFCALR